MQVHTSGGLLCGVDATGTSSARKIHYTNDSIADGAWHHCAFSFSANDLRLYIDGVRITSLVLLGNDTVNNIHNSTSDILIGASLSTTPTWHIDGSVADCRIYDTDLSASDISDLYNGTNVTTNLVGHWIKDTPSLLDHAGNNDATNYGSKFSYDNPSPDVEFGSMSRSFNGTSDYVNLGDSDDFSFGDGSNDSPFSLSLWVKCDLPIGNIQTMLAKATNSSNVEYLFNLTGSGEVSLVLHQASAGYGSYLEARSNSAYTQNEWIHVVATYDGSLSSNGINVYFNGVNDTGLRQSGGTYDGQSNTTAELLIGNRKTSSGQEMSGNIADVRIYDNVLSSTDVSDLYAGTNVTTNLIGHWLTNNDDVKDYAGVNDGTNFGSTYSYDNPNALVEYGSMSRSFNSTDFVLIPDPDESNTSLTAMCWLKTSATGWGSVVMGHQDINANNRSWVITMSNSADGSGTKLRVVLDQLGTGDSSSQKDYWATTGTVSDGTWHHCAFSWDSGTLKLFVDGVEESVTKKIDASFTSINNSAGKMSLACVLDGSTGLAITSVQLADVRIYDNVLSSTEVYELYKGVDHRTNLIGQWLTNSDDVEDKAGINDGTNFGSTYSTDSPL
jgi:hypothetical protein